MKSVVTAARLYAEQVNTFSTTQLLVLSDNLAHEAIVVKSYLFSRVYQSVCTHVSDVFSRFTHFTTLTN